MSVRKRHSPVRNQPLPPEFPGLNYLDDGEVQAVLRVMGASRLFRYYEGATESEATAFEREFAAYIGVAHALAVTSGTAALHTALAALGVGPGQEILVPAYLWVSVAAAVVNLGAIPVLTDIDATFCMDPASAAEKMTSRTRGIIAVHMSGGQADLPSLLALARRHGIFLLEDCAQCAGGSIGGKKVGSFGDIATFSFQINKNMTSGEGGCLATNDKRLYQRAVACHDTGILRPEKGQFPVDASMNLWGRGYRLDELRAAVLRVQLQRLPAVLERMRGSKARIRKPLETDPQVQLRRFVDPAGETGGFLMLTLRDPETATRLSRILKQDGIATANPDVSNTVVAEYGLHIYSNIRALVEKSSTDPSGAPWSLAENQGSHPRYDKGTCPVADDLFSRSVILSVPSCLSDRDEADMIAGFDQALQAIEGEAVYSNEAGR